MLRCGEFRRDQPAQPTQPGGRGALPAHFAVERMRHAHLQPANGGFEHDEAAGVGVLDGRWRRDPPQGRQLNRLANGQRIDHLTYRSR